MSRPLGAAMLARRTCLVLLAAFAVSAAHPGPARAQTRIVAVTAIVEHPALDAARRGVRDALAAAGWEQGGNLDLRFRSAQGSRVLADAIAEEFVALSPDVIVPISTPSTQAVARATDAVAVVFAAVSDPLAAGLVRDLAHPGGNVTGVSDFSPVGQHLDLIKAIAPAATRIGVVHNPAEANSLSLLEALRREVPMRGLQLLTAGAGSAAEVARAAERLAREVDALYVPTDNTVVQALEAVVAVGAAQGVPVFAADTESVVRGAIAARGFNYYELGRQTGSLVARVLAGEKPGDIPVQQVVHTELYLNPKAAAAMGTRIPEELLKAATWVVE